MHFLMFYGITGTILRRTGIMDWRSCIFWREAKTAIWEKTTGSGWKKADFLVINSRVVHSVQCPRQCKEMLLQIPYPMMKRFIPQIDGLEFVCERISGKKHQMDTSQVEQSLSILAGLRRFSCRKRPWSFTARFIIYCPCW